MFNIENATHLKQVFLESESKYTNELMKKQGMFNLIRECSEEKDSYVLFATAQKLIDKIDLGLVKEEELERVETQIIILLAAIKDNPPPFTYQKQLKKNSSPII